MTEKPKAPASKNSQAANPKKNGGETQAAPAKNSALEAALGASLATKPASNYMTRTPAYVTPTATIRLAMQMMLTHKVSGLPVVDSNLNVVGVYSEVDAMLQASAQNIDSPIKFTKPAKTVKVNTPLREVLIFLVQNRLKRVPVIDGANKLAGIITRRDVMAVFFKDAQEK